MVEPTKGEILAYASLGYELVRWKGQPYFVNLDLESSRLKFRQYLEKETNKKWGIFKENTGNKNWVWYREDMYQVDDGYIRLANNYNGRVELPINASSCWYMFSDRNLACTNLDYLDTSDIVTMEGMFVDCTLLENFNPRWNTGKVEDMRKMFKYATFYNAPKLAWDTSNVMNMKEMFMGSRLAENFRIAWNTSNVMSMRDMFNSARIGENSFIDLDTTNADIDLMFTLAEFGKGFKFGDRFSLPNNADSLSIFYRAKLNYNYLNGTTIECFNKLKGRL